MSTQPVPSRTPSAADYLAFERGSEEKHEFVGGEIRLMSGATRAHNLIGVNLTRVIGNQLVDRPCEAYTNDMRVKVAADGQYVYPDFLVACDEPEFEDGEFDTLLNPTAIFEILSRSTAEYDRVEKFASYRTLGSLREYVLVSQHAAKIEHFVRLEDGAWRFNPVEGLSSQLELVTADLKLSLSEIYAKVRFEADA